MTAGIQKGQPYPAALGTAGTAPVRIPRAPGFVCDWLEPVAEVGLSFVVFDTREHAEQAAAYPLPALPGVSPLTVEIREVYASA